MLVAVSGGCRAFLSNPAVHLTGTRTRTLTLSRPRLPLRPCEAVLIRHAQRERCRLV